jgi:hypothetical protein
MEAKKNDLGNRLLAQQGTQPEKRSHYEKEVEAMLEKLRQESWWLGVAHASIVVLFAVVLFFTASVLCYFTCQVVFYPELLSFLLLALGWCLFFLAALALLWHLNRRTQMNDVLLQVKGLDMRLLELEEAQRSGDERNRG